MKHAVLLSALLLSVPVWAAEVKTNFFDHSSRSLIDEATAKKVMKESIPAKAWRIYPASKYVFVSQVEGGISGTGMCVVAARVMVLPLTATVRAPLFRPLPKMTATAFDAMPGANADQCKTLAREMLKQATGAVVSSIVKT